MSRHDYVHGYSDKEKERLEDQAETLTSLLHHDSMYPEGSRVLEAGCGVGAQTITLATQNPKTQFTSIDISEKSLAEASKKIMASGRTNVNFQVANIFALPFASASFDHIFLCFVLEHLPEPVKALQALMTVLKPGGTVTAIEGDHGSTYFHPDSQAAHKAIQCLTDLQAQAGGNSLIGRELYPLMEKSGLRDICVSPRMVYVDDSKPELVEGFTRNTFAAMVAGVEQQALEKKLIDKATWEKGIEDLYKTAEGRGTFCYTFFKARGMKKDRTSRD